MQVVDTKEPEASAVPKIFSQSLPASALSEYERAKQMIAQGRRFEIGLDLLRNLSKELSKFKTHWSQELCWIDGPEAVHCFDHEGEEMAKGLPAPSQAALLGQLNSHWSLWEGHYSKIESGVLSWIPFDPPANSRHPEPWMTLEAIEGGDFILAGTRFIGHDVDEDEESAFLLSPSRALISDIEYRGRARGQKVEWSATGHSNHLHILNGQLGSAGFRFPIPENYPEGEVFYRLGKYLSRVWIAGSRWVSLDVFAGELTLHAWEPLELVS